MSKAVLVMDMPKTCGECMLARLVNGNQVMCSIDRLSTRELTDAEKDRPDWCPLKRMPVSMK